MWILDGQARERAKGRGDRLNRRSTRLEAGKSWNRVGVFAALALGSLLAAACGGAEPEARAPVVHERPEDEILRIGRTWQATHEDKGFRTPPSAVSMFSELVTSTLTFSPGARDAVEAISLDGTFKVRDATYHCQAHAELRVAVTFGRHADEAAVEVGRPSAQVARTCDLPGFPEPVVQIPLSAARFALRGDRLVAFAPPTERRAFLPVP
jgi:hypothetical protein